jgi:hypothetical protein
MAVWRRNVRAWRNRELEHPETLRVGAVDDVVDAEPAYRDSVVVHEILVG